HPGRRELRDIAFLVDEAGVAGVGGAGQVAAGFDAAQAAVAQQLAVAGRVEPPSIVGTEREQRSPVGHVLGHKVAVDAFVADERRGAQGRRAGRGRVHGALGLAAIRAHKAAQINVIEYAAEDGRN
nr:hypothetical protein [Tanacetum cinerariifolium]